jgi:hypothetical protein
MFAFERFTDVKAFKSHFLSGFPLWHSYSNDAGMKRQLRYRTLTIALGIVVALLIVITLWTAVGNDTPASPKAEKEISFALKSVIRLQPLFEIAK